ncbi:unnamed protein product [Lathyrus oleraceus]
MQFYEPRSTRRRTVRSVEQPIDDVEVVHAQDVHGPTVETDATHIVDEMIVDEVVQPDVVVVDEVVQPDVVVVDPVSSATTDTKITVPSTESSVHTDEGFSGEPIERSVLIEYADHVAYQLWQGKMKSFPKTLMLKEAILIICDFELLDFAHCSFTMLDASPLTAFVERWYKETFSFHLPFGEMAITLNDASSLFHLPIADRLLTAVAVNS